MFNEEDVNRFINDGVLRPAIYEPLLNIYVAKLDNGEWINHAKDLNRRLSRQSNQSAANEMTRRVIAFTILLPSVEPSFKADSHSPQRILFGAEKFSNFSSRDWVADLKKVVKQNQQISLWRKDILLLGVVDPIEHKPDTRQAYKWLCDEAEKAEVELTDELRNKFRQLVMVYGGTVVSNIFTNHRKQIGNKVTNWRSGYFFERLIFMTYSIDQIMRMKRAELEKANPKLIKQVEV